MVKFFVGLAVGLVLGVGGTFVALVIIGLAASNAQRANAQGDNRRNSTASTLQTLRGQIELFKIQHEDRPPAPTALALVLSGKTNGHDVNTTNPMGSLGPYVQQFPTNPLNGKSAVGAAPSPNVGWVYTVKGDAYNIQAVDAAGTGVLSY